MFFFFVGLGGEGGGCDAKTESEKSGGGGGGGGTEKQLRIWGLVGRGQHFPCSPFLWGFYLPTTMASILRVYKAFLIFEKKY